MMKSVSKINFKKEKEKRRNQEENFSFKLKKKKTYPSTLRLCPQERHLVVSAQSSSVVMLLREGSGPLPVVLFVVVFTTG